MAQRRGPIETPDDFVPGKDAYDATEDCTYDGLDGEPYSKHKGTGGKIKEVTLDQEGVFGRVPQED